MTRDVRRRLWLVLLLPAYVVGAFVAALVVGARALWLTWWADWQDDRW
jgi:hypothetical protein